jgi:signal transduction histidine kinase
MMFKRLHLHVEGTGIGLSIIKKIIDNNGGKVRLTVKLEKERSSSSISKFKIPTFLGARQSHIVSLNAYLRISPSPAGRGFNRALRFVSGSLAVWKRAAFPFI